MAVENALFRETRKISTFSVKIVLCVNTMYSTICWKHSRL